MAWLPWLCFAWLWKFSNLGVVEKSCIAQVCDWQMAVTWWRCWYPLGSRRHRWQAQRARKRTCKRFRRALLQRPHKLFFNLWAAFFQWRRQATLSPPTKEGPLKSQANSGKCWWNTDFLKNKQAKHHWQRLRKSSGNWRVISHMRASAQPAGKNEKTKQNKKKERTTDKHHREPHEERGERKQC